MALLKLIALILTAIALVPSAAHLFELPGKLDLARDPYFTVQSIYAGWSMFAVPIIAAILANVVLAVAHWRHHDRRAIYSGVAATLIAGSLIIFFIWAFPGNQQTANWTNQPENWELLRRNWEYGHAANAVIVFVAFVATCIASIDNGEQGRNEVKRD
jgi:phosphatidylglycerophosphate synthase